MEITDQNSETRKFECALRANHGQNHKVIFSSNDSLHSHGFQSMWAVVMCYQVAKECMISHFKITHLPSTPFQRTFRFRLLLFFSGVIQESVFQYLHCLSSYLHPKQHFNLCTFYTITLMKCSKCLAYILWWQRFVSPGVSQIEQATEACTG